MYWSNHNQDNYTGAEGEHNEGYTAFTNVGYVLKNPIPGTVPLHVYRSKKEYLTATPNAAQGILNKENDKGYQQFKTLGHVYEKPSQGRRELRLYFNSDRGDYFTTATQAGYDLAEQYNYKLLGTVGYVPETPN